MIRKVVLTSLCLILGIIGAAAQKRITGTVVDANGEAVFGASVRIDDSKQITVTDEKGFFEFPSVPASAKKFNVSFIGMESQSVAISENVKITMKADDKLLEEAVVVGYGSAKKLGTLVGSVKKVGSEAINGKPVMNVADALQGQVSGMSVLNSDGDAGTLNSVEINIRGKGSLNGGNTPLIVVDGSPTTSSVFAMMNSEDIESITTLKDASATSIYGSRASNGVIYITTKKGRRGEKAEIRISQKVGWSQLARPIHSDLPSSAELLDFQFENSIITVDNYIKYKSHGANTDWQDYYFKSAAPMYTTDFSIRGGGEKTSYFVSASYNDQEGIVSQSDMKRYTLRTNLDSKPKDWLQFGINQSITYTDRLKNRFTQPGGSNTGSDYQNSSVMLPPYFDPYDPESAEKGLIWGSGQYAQDYILELSPYNYNDIVYNGTAFLQLMPFKGFTLRSQLGLYAGNTRTHLKVSPENPIAEGTGGTTTEMDDRFSLWTITNTLEYKFNVKGSNFTVLLGQEGIKFNNSAFSASTQGITDERMDLLGNGTEVSELPSSSMSAYKYLSFFGRLDYSLYNRYFANFTVRSDASSRFAPDNRTAMFYSGGLMWNAKNERFLRHVKWLSALQLKASVGSTGNSEIGNYGYFGLISSTKYGGEAAWLASQPANPTLGWEKQIQTNVGFNISFINKLHLDVNFYHRKTLDMLMSTPLPYTTGFTLQLKNIGEMSNRGVELELSYDVFRTKTAFLNLRATYSYNENRIDKLFYDLEEWPMSSYLTSYNVGESMNYYMPIFAGVDQNDGAAMWYKVGHKGDVVHSFNPETMTKDYNNINELSQNTGIKRDAPHNGGFGFTVGWKGLSLSADFSYVLKKYMVNQVRYWLCDISTMYSGYNVDKDMFSAWKKPGDITEIPALNENYFQFDTRYLENASFMRLKNLTLNYDIPTTEKMRRYISGIRFSFTGRNLFTITKYTGADPEVNTNIAFGGVPSTRQYVIGLDITF